MASCVLELRNVSKTYRGPQAVPALRDVSLQIAAGELVAVRGPSGSGKSTLLLAAGGLLQPDAGQVLLAGQDLYKLSAEGRARVRATGLGFVFQQFHLVPYLTVLDNVLSPALAAAVADARTRAADLLERFGLTSRLQHVPAELSTGERQRTALARALLHKPKLILADEPTGNLDEENGRIVLEHLRAFARDGGAVLLVTHDADAARQAQRLLRLEAGRLV